MNEPPVELSDGQTVSYAPATRRHASFSIVFSLAVLILQLGLLLYSLTQRAEQRFMLPSPLQPGEVVGVGRGCWIWIHVIHDLNSATSRTITDVVGVQWVHFAGSLFSIKLNMAWTIGVNVANIGWLVSHPKRRSNRNAETNA